MDIDSLLPDPRETARAKARAYEQSVVRQILKWSQRTDLVRPLQDLSEAALGERIMRLSDLVKLLELPCWLRATKLQKLAKLEQDLWNRPTKSAAVEAYRTLCDDIDLAATGCGFRGVVFDWPHHGRYIVIHDGGSEYETGHGWFVDLAGVRLVVQPLLTLLTAIGLVVRDGETNG